MPGVAGDEPLSVGERVVVGGAGGRQRSVAARVVAKQEFAGYWEYVVDEAIFTAPSHPNWGGTALIGPAGDLLGIGSLQLQEGREQGPPGDINMIVPIDLLNRSSTTTMGRHAAAACRALCHRAGRQPWWWVCRTTGAESRLACGDILLGRRAKPRSRGFTGGCRLSAGSSSDVDLPRWQDHRNARQDQRTRPIPQGAEIALVAVASLFVLLMIRSH
jgi:hypothetical protein